MISHIQLLRLYYLFTPLFAVLDFGFGIDIRFRIPWDYDTVSILYYAACFLGGLFAFKNRLAAALFGLFECSFNILLLLLSVMWPIAMLGENIENGAAPLFRFGPEELAQFMIEGSVLAYSFYLSPLINRPPFQDTD